MATPSLAMIPSAYADSKVYSVLPNNGDGDFTFNRDSSATRVGQNGLIQEVGFFGSELTTNGSFNGNANNWVFGSSYAYGNNNIIATSANSDLSQTNVYGANGKYKISLDITQYSAGALRVIDYSGTTLGNFSISGIGTFSIIVDFSNSNKTFYLRASSSLSATIDNISVKEVTGDQPRLNYDISNGVVQSCPSLLLEPASTNVINYSEQASNNTIVNSLTVTDNFAISPDGKQTAFQVNCLAGTFRRIRQIYSVSAGSAYAMSFFVKKSLTPVSTYTGMGMVWQGGTQKVNYIIVDEFNGTLTVLQDQTLNLTTKVEDSGQYWRFSVGATDTGSNTSFEAAFYGCLSNNGSSTGDGAKIWIGWGLQVEALSYATSYIPTNGASQTRAAESCNGAGTASTFNSTEGVLYAEIKALSENGGNRYISLSDGTDLNRILLRFQDTDKVGCYVRSTSGSDADITKNSASISSSFLKVAVKWKTNDVALWVNGVKIGVDSSFTTFNANVLDRLNFAGTNSTSQYFYGNTKDIRVYNEALTDAQLQTLTT